MNNLFAIVIQIQPPKEKPQIPSEPTRRILPERKQIPVPTIPVIPPLTPPVPEIPPKTIPPEKE